jgi:hypothetical protein
MTDYHQLGFRLDDAWVDQLPFLALPNLPHRYCLERREDEKLQSPSTDTTGMRIAVDRPRFGTDSLPVGLFGPLEHQFACASIAHVSRLFAEILIVPQRSTEARILTLGTVESRHLSRTGCVTYWLGL